MPKVKQWGAQVIDIWRALKDEQLSWRINNQAQQQQLKHRQALAENDLVGQLKIRSVQLEHELAVLKTTHQTQLVMLKTKCQQDIKDYKQYLAALDQLKISIQNSYTQLPEVVAFTIHHHAKQLLNAMWEAKTVDEKVQREMQLVRLMSTIQEDTRMTLKSEGQSQLPEKTLQLLQYK
ncbi:MAG: hypothetical protein ABL903_01225 [Methylococcales bacterium]